MNITPDSMVFFQLGPIVINATIGFTWLVMLILVGGSWLITRRLTVTATIPAWQNVLEVVVTGIQDQIEEISQQKTVHYLPFIGTLFLYILVCNIFAIIPGFTPPTGSLSTTTALALCVFIAVPLFGIAHEGLLNYLKHYIDPTPLMLPFNVIGELSRTIALAVRLYGNIMSGTVIVGILLSLAPFIFPVVMQILGLITGAIQAYIFAILAMVYIASATAAHNNDAPLQLGENNGKS